MRGYERLMQSVKKDCNENNSCGCFNEGGCNVSNSRIGSYGEEGSRSCFHPYCDKFKWVIERAKHYEERLNIPWEEVLDSWEEDREYWYMNYYQECNQPRIDNERVRVFETLEEYKKSAVHSEYECPSCGKITDNAYTCRKCGWSVSGLFGDLGKGVFVYIKDKRRGETIFKPKAWGNKKG